MQENNGINIQDLLEAGVHFGHLRSKWNPQMAPYIFKEMNGIHLIDLNKTVYKLEEAASAMKNIARSGRKILFVATKKQAKDIVKEAAINVNMPFVTERWLGGMLTNFSTVRKSIKKMTNIDKMVSDGTMTNMAKRERLMMTREREKLERMLGGINDLRLLPAALFIVDIKKEHIAVAEAHKLNLTTFGIVDTNADPNEVDFAIPGNDDAAKSIAYITGVIAKAIEEGLQERKKMKETLKAETESEEPAAAAEKPAEQE
ncbi:MAG: 30S ribosomal protein S2 [Bacteroidota bacterium]|nr:30S ribosomal protein S2 [Bacteroidota bacterium]